MPLSNVITMSRATTQRARAAAPEDATLARRMFALETARLFWQRHGPKTNVTLDLALAERIDGFLAALWTSEKTGQRKAAMAALSHAARSVRSETSLLPVASFLAEAWTSQRKAALAALGYAMRLVKHDDDPAPVAREALHFLVGPYTRS